MPIKLDLNLGLKHRKGNNMTQEDKDLLLVDLCARLPYGVFCNMGLDYPLPLQRLLVDKLDGILLDFYEDGKDYQVYLSEVKPYLRPMSSMTEEERKEYEGFIIHRDHVNAQGQEWDIDCFSFDTAPRLINWLNAHHFDYRGLIPKGLALEATKGMYNLK